MNDGRVASRAAGPPSGVEVRLQGAIDGVDAKHPDAAIAVADWIFLEAARAGASDVHLHPLAEGVEIRLRVDGRLSAPARLERALGEATVVRLKVLAKLASYQRVLPQDGRIAWQPEWAAAKAGWGEVRRVRDLADSLAVRAAFLPTRHGEDVVLRLPLAGVRPGGGGTPGSGLSLPELGFGADHLRRAEALLRRESGLVLLTGPSSAGKTTTIYALLRGIHESRPGSAHVLTLEDPVEQDLPFAGQVAIRADQGLTWAAGLRSILRHDPNVLMIGEIRDRETAEIATEAGLTGHLVIATMHSGRAAGVLVRLVQMGIEPFLVASSVSDVVAQRLVRRVCVECAKAAAPDALALARAEALAPGAFAEAGGALVEGAGCDACGGFGTRGRTGVFEWLEVTTAVRERVIERATESVLMEVGFSGGGDGGDGGARPGRCGATLAHDAIAKAGAGTIPASELSRVLASL